MMNLIALAARPGWLVLIGVAWAIVFGLILVTVGQISDVSGGSGILDFEVGYSVETVAKILGSYGIEGLRLYQRVQMLDLLNPALYSLLLAGVSYLLWRGSGRERLAHLAFLGGLGDYLENVTLLLIVADFPEIDGSLIGISSALSLIKNGLLVVAVAPLVAGLGRKALSRRGQ